MPAPTKSETPANRRKCLAIMIVGIILQTLIIVTFILIFLSIRSPAVRFLSLTVENLTINSTNSPSFSIRLNGIVTVKNSNLGHFEFPDSTISIFYREDAIGSVVIPGAQAGALSTQKLNVRVEAGTNSNTDRLLGGDLNSGKITLSSHATLKGKILVFKLIKKKKTAVMNCSMDVSVNTNERAVENLKCR